MICVFYFVTGGSENMLLTAGTCCRYVTEHILQKCSQPSYSVYKILRFVPVLRTLQGYFQQSLSSPSIKVDIKVDILSECDELGILKMI